MSSTANPKKSLPSKDLVAWFKHPWLKHSWLKYPQGADDQSALQPAIAAQGIEMVFTTKAGRFPVLKGFDLAVCRNTLQLLMGPAGAGKTTLMLILAGLLTPTAGHVTLLGQDLAQMDRAHLEQFRLQHLGFVDQDFNLFSALTALENVSVPLTLKGYSERQARREARSLLEQIGLGDRLHNLPRELSGGQQQRVAVARAIAGAPDLILADEPTSALDSQTGALVMTLFRQLVQEHGSTVLIATHDSRTMPQADRVVFLEDGMIQHSSRVAGMPICLSIPLDEPVAAPGHQLQDEPDSPDGQSDSPEY